MNNIKKETLNYLYYKYKYDTKNKSLNVLLKSFIKKIINIVYGYLTVRDSEMEKVQPSIELKLNAIVEKYLLHILNILSSNKSYVDLYTSLTEINGKFDTEDPKKILKEILNIYDEPEYAFKEIFPEEIRPSIRSRIYNSTRRYNCFAKKRFLLEEVDGGGSSPRHRKTRKNNKIYEIKKIKIIPYHKFYKLKKYNDVFTIRVAKCIKKKDKLLNEKCEIEWINIPKKYDKKEYPFVFTNMSKNKLFDFWYFGDADYKISFV